MKSSADGYIDFKGYKTYYLVYGDLQSSKLPLLVLHGGPGYPHYYLENLSELSQDRAVIFYDQLGCGKSDRPDRPELWNVPFFVEELAAVRKALNLEQIHLLGHSWGGSLAIEYTLTKPNGVHGLVLASPVINSQLWTSEAERITKELSPELAQTLKKHELALTTSDPEYQAAYGVFLDNFVCRMQPKPEGYVRSNQENGQQVYETMWGPSESRVMGNMKDWDVTSRLQEIHNPTLITSGKYDEATPPQMEILDKNIANSKWVLFEQSAHCSHLEEPEKYLRTIRDFLDQVER